MKYTEFTKKLVALLAVAAVLALAGCSSGASASGQASSKESAPVAASAASVSQVSVAEGMASAESLGAEVSAARNASASAEIGSAASAAPTALQHALENGKYLADFKTDSSMFHVNEACDGQGELTVTDEGMSIHVSLVSKKIVNVYAGKAEQAKENPDDVIQPTTDEVTYRDGMREEVYGFDIPVPAIDEEFDVAILGEKGTWYDHKVTVSNPVGE